MNRHVAFTLAVAAMVFSMNAALAGSSNSQFVRIKNIGSGIAKVKAVNGSSIGPGGGKTLSQNQVAQFNLKKGIGVAAVVNNAGSAGQTLPYNFPKSTYVYLTAQADAAAATMTFAKPGTRF
jgi:hypothetical protein